MVTSQGNWRSSFLEATSQNTHISSTSAGDGVGECYKKIKLILNIASVCGKSPDGADVIALCISCSQSYHKADIKTFFINLLFLHPGPARRWYRSCTVLWRLLLLLLFLFFFFKGNKMSLLHSLSPSHIFRRRRHAETPSSLPSPDPQGCF